MSSEKLQNDTNDTPVPCPICGRRIMDVKGRWCGGDFEIELKCQGTRSCGFVKIGAKYIEKYLNQIRLKR